MKFANRNSQIVFNRDLIVRVVQAVVKAVTEDAPHYRREHHLETNNAAKFIAGDYINENLRNLVASDSIHLHHFQRFAWDGCLLIDHENKVTYTIVSATTLAAAPQKHRSNPYYLQSILFAENGACNGNSKQMSISDYFTDQDLAIFPVETYYADFDEIMQGEVTISSDYRHYIVAYKVARSEVTDLQLLFLDRDFDVIDAVDLMEYITPDFALLTAAYTDNLEESAQVEAPTVKLKLREGVKPLIRATEDEA